MDGMGSVGVMGLQLGPRSWIGGAGVATCRVWRWMSTSGWMWYDGGGTGIAAVLSTNWTSQSSSERGYLSSGSSEEGMGSARDELDLETIGKIGGGATLARVGMVIDSVAQKLTNMVDLGLSNIVAQWEIIAACMNAHEYVAPSLSVSSSICSSWYSCASSMTF